MLTHGFRWATDINNEDFERVQRHFRNIKLDEVAKDQDVQNIANLLMRKFVSHEGLHPSQHADILDGGTAAHPDFSISPEESDASYRCEIILLREGSIAMANHYTASGYNATPHQLNDMGATRPSEPLVNNAATYRTSATSTYPARMATSQEVYDESQLHPQSPTSNISGFVAHPMMSHEAYGASLYPQPLTPNISDFVAHPMMSHEAYGASLYPQPPTPNISDFVAHPMMSHEAYGASLYPQPPTPNISDYVAYPLALCNISRYCGNSDGITDPNVYQPTFDRSVETQENQAACSEINAFAFPNRTSSCQARYPIC